MADRERRLQHSPLADDDEHLTPASLERLRSLERDYRSSRVSIYIYICVCVCSMCMWACLFQEIKGGRRRRRKSKRRMLMMMLVV